MNRRNLFSMLVAASRRPMGEPQAIPMVEGGSEEHTDPLTLEDVLHLYRRLGYSVSMPEAKTRVGRTAGSIVDELLGPDDPGLPAQPVPFAKWRDPASGELVEYTENPNGADLQTRLGIERWWETNHKILANWWIAQLRTDQTAVERITAFWLSHWITEFSFDETNLIPQEIFNQYLLLRKDRLGDFSRMALDMTVDNAMLYYLGGTLNDVGRPNENYARELMELFTTGIGWYTEGDVQQAARVLTGWKSARYTDQPRPKGIYVSWFNATQHDTGAKQFMGVTIPARTADNNTEFQVLNEEVFELIKIILRVRAEAASKFIARKMYLFFVYSSPGDVDPVIIDELAATFRSSNWNIRPLVRKLFTSKHFFDPALRGAQIKTPIEFVTGLQRQLGVIDADPQSSTEVMDQVAFDAPNVAGWPGYRAWISTNTYPRRRAYARKMVDDMSDTRVNAFVREFDNYADVDAFVKGVCTFMLPVAVSEERLAFYKAALLEGQPDYTWAEKLAQPSSTSRAVKELLKAIFRAPDFQLC